MLSYEYRVVVRPEGLPPRAERVLDEREAVEELTAWHKFYPRTRVIVERREVGSWKPYEPCE